MVRDIIIPEADIRIFPQGVNEKNLSDFFRDVVLYVDGLDFFAFEARERVFDYCACWGIPAVTVAPLGMSAALLNFLPGGMSFEDYFQVGADPNMIRPYPSWSAWPPRCCTGITWRTKAGSISRPARALLPSWPASSARCRSQRSAQAPARSQQSLGCSPLHSIQRLRKQTGPYLAPRRQPPSPESADDSDRATAVRDAAKRVL